MPKENANRVLNALIDHGLEGALAVAEEIAGGLRRFTRTADDWQDYLAKARRWIGRHEPLLARTLSDSLLAGWLTGADGVVKELPAVDVPEVPLIQEPLLPPTFAGGDIPGEPEPLIRFPIIEEASTNLAVREVMFRSDFDALATEAKSAAFTVARVSSLDALEKLQEVLVHDVSQGGTLREFRAKVDDVMGETSLSPGHLENVYRTNISASYAVGQQRVLNQVLVTDAFPYLAYHAVHDSRTEQNHRKMEKLGIDGTNIYRRDDPVIQKFWPPWRWQ